MNEFSKWVIGLLIIIGLGSWYLFFMVEDIVLSILVIIMFVNCVAGVIIIYNESEKKRQKDLTDLGIK